MVLQNVIDWIGVGSEVSQFFRYLLLLHLGAAFLMAILNLRHLVPTENEGEYHLPGLWCVLLYFLSLVVISFITLQITAEKALVLERLLPKVTEFVFYGYPRWEVVLPNLVDTIVGLVIYMFINGVYSSFKRVNWEWQLGLVTLPLLLSYSFTKDVALLPFRKLLVWLLREREGESFELSDTGLTAIGAVGTKIVEHNPKASANWSAALARHRESIVFDTISYRGDLLITMLSAIVLVMCYRADFTPLLSVFWGACIFSLVLFAVGRFGDYLRDWHGWKRGFLLRAIGESRLSVMMVYGLR